MKTVLNNQKYNTRLEASDWRYSASIVGLIKYFNYFNIDYSGYDNDVDVIEYNQDDLKLELYLQFVEKYFEEDMHHRIVEDLLEVDELSEEQIKLLNGKLSANSIMKKVFSTVKFPLENKDKILSLINEHRDNLIKGTYINGKNLYTKFSNQSCFFRDNQRTCRLQGYYVDKGRKTKSISYGFNKETFLFSDEKEFDFIPFAFSQSFDSFFINNNYTIRQLFETNRKIERAADAKSFLFAQIKESADFANFDVEIIMKSRDSDYFESLYIRKKAINVIREIDNYNSIKFNYKISENLYIHFEQEVVDRILNNLILDDLIELLLKDRSANNYSYRVNQFIKINTKLYGGVSMDKDMKAAYACAKEVKKKIPSNKVNSYKQKLISAIVFHDYDRVCEVLLQLSSYSGVVFNFAYDLFGDFEKHKNVAYTFINTLNTYESEEKEKGEYGNEKK